LKQMEGTFTFNIKTSLFCSSLIRVEYLATVYAQKDYASTDASPSSLVYRNSCSPSLPVALGPLPSSQIHHVLINLVTTARLGRMRGKSAAEDSRSST